MRPDVVAAATCIVEIMSHIKFDDQLAGRARLWEAGMTEKATRFRR